MNITNYIIICLISIVLVLFIFYENPFLIKKNKEGFELSGNTNGGNDNSNDNSNDDKTKDNSTEVIINNSLIREYAKIIFSMERIEVDDGIDTIIDAIKKNIILTTKKIRSVNDYMNIDDIEDDIVSNNKGEEISKIDEITQTTKNSNIKLFIQKLRLIGKDVDDFTRTNRDNDFFLRMENGIEIDINFNDNYDRNFSDKLKTDIKINELLPDNFEGTEEDKDRYKSYEFKDCNIQVDRISNPIGSESNVTDTITLEINGETNINDDYLEILNDGIEEEENKCKSIFATQTVIIKIVLNKNKNIGPDTKFKELIENINTGESTVSYQLGFRYLNNSGLVLMPQNGIYKVTLYLQNVKFNIISMNEWLTSSINKENEELLNKKLESIITPMFDVDNKIEKREKIVKRIHDIYRFNKLSNSQNTLRFYNSHY